MGKDLTPLSGHLDGFCSLRFFPGGEHRAVTCGRDALIRVHDLEKINDDDGEGQVEIDHFEEALYAVAVRRDGAVIAAGGAENHVGLFDAAKHEFIASVARSKLAIRDLSFSPTSSLLAVASDDADIKIVDSDKHDDVDSVKTLEGHVGGVKAVAFDPKGALLASAGTDCTVRVWDVATGNQVKAFTKAYPKKSAAGTADLDGASADAPKTPSNLCQVAWSPDGSLLAVAGNTEVKVFARDSWEEKDAFVGGDVDNEVSCLAFSPNGLYLLTVDTGGKLIVWDVQSRESVHRYDNDKKILQASWDPMLNAVAVISETGAWGHITGVIPDDRMGPADMFDDDDELEDAQSFGAGGEEEEDDLLLTPGKNKRGREHESEGRGRPVRFEPEVERQEPFQPQSTPMEGKRRFMAYTYDGFITCRSDSTSNFIEIEFADIELHRPIRFNDYAGFTMAAMGSIGAVFASPEIKQGTDVTASTIFYRPFDSWAAQSDWTVHLRKGEEATALAIGSTFVAVSTTTWKLRIFSFSGVQLHVFSLPAPCVCMSGHGDLLGVMNHMPSSPSPSGDQALEFQLMDIKTRRLVVRGPVCLSPGSTIEWFSVLPTGMIAAMDSEGIASVYTQAMMGGQWCPVLDIKDKNKPRDWFWPIGIDEGHLTGVVCKIEKRYPDAIQPVVSRFELEVPLSKADAGEEKWQRGQIFLAHDAMQEEDEEVAKRALDLDKCLLQLVNVACEQEKLMRALDLAMLIKSEKALKAAITLAQRHRLPVLAEKIDFFRMTKIEEEEAAAAAAAQQGQYEGYEEEYEEEEQHESPRAAKRARTEEDGGVVDDASDDGRDNTDNNESLETPPGPSGGAVQRRPASIFAIKNTNAQAGLKEGVKFADRMKSIQQKQHEASKLKPMPPGSGFGAKKGMGVGKGRKGKVGK